MWNDNGFTGIFHYRYQQWVGSYIENFILVFCEFVEKYFLMCAVY